MDSLQEAARWAREALQSPPPGWEALPGIPLYMDQVLLYLGECLAPFLPQGEEAAGPLTSSMVNNYVKHGLLPHPERKKYRKEHLAALMAVCMLKQALPIQDVKALLEAPMGQEAYGRFLEAHQSALEETARSLEAAAAAGEDPGATALRLAAEAYAKRAAAQRLLEHPGQPPQEAQP